VKISHAESLVMQALWRQNPRSAEDICAALAADQGWEDSTVRTLLGRLVKKGALATEKDGRRYLYRPLIAREDYVEAESQNLLDRLFDGRVGPLFTHFSERRKLSADDIAELRRLIEEFEDGQ
jgi:predicted transcriptional regulator